MLFLSSIILERNLLFDDSFISYRYAANLADGHGITWNVGEKPVEGYTHFSDFASSHSFLLARLLPAAAAYGTICQIVWGAIKTV